MNETGKTVIIVLFGLGVFEIGLLLGLGLLLFGPALVPRLGRRVGEVVGTTGEVDAEFQAGREE